MLYLYLSVYLLYFIHNQCKETYINITYIDIDIFNSMVKVSTTFIIQC